MNRLINAYRRWKACRALERDRQLRMKMIGQPYARRRAAALKGRGRGA